MLDNSTTRVCILNESGEASRKMRGLCFIRVALPQNPRATEGSLPSCNRIAGPKSLRRSKSGHLASAFQTSWVVARSAWRAVNATAAEGSRGCLCFVECVRTLQLLKSTPTESGRGTSRIPMCLPVYTVSLFEDLSHDDRLLWI